MNKTDVNRDTTVLFTWKVNKRLKNYLMTHLNDEPHLNLIFPEPQDEILLDSAPKADILVGWRVKDEIKLAAKKWVFRMQSFPIKLTLKTTRNTK